MRCLKCKKFNWFYPKKCRHCGTPNLGKIKKHHRVLWTIIITIAVLITLFAFIGITVNKQFNNAIEEIQKNLVDVGIAKTKGDLIMAGQKTEATVSSIQTTAINAAKKIAELSVPSELKSYQASAIIWSIKIATAIEQKSGWKNLKSKPNNFPLILTDIKAENSFKSSLIIIGNLKKIGEEAIKNNNRQIMSEIGTEILIQNHWLNAILHSKNDSTAFNPLTFPVFAASSNGLQPVPEVKGMDVTCLVCSYPDVYKVHWTDKLRQQYGCEVRCNPKKEKGGKEKSTEQNNYNEEVKNAEILENYNYTNTPKRTICIGMGGVSVGKETTHKYCVEEALQSTNDIAASAIGFSENIETLTAIDWQEEFDDIEIALGISQRRDSADTVPSQPTAEGGHKEGGQGTVQQGEPIAPVESAKKMGGVWDGYYELSGNCTEVCTGGVCALAEALGGEKQGATKSYSKSESFYVLNNKITRYNEEVVAPGIINASGYAKIITFPDNEGYEQFQFTRNSGANSVKMNTHLNMVGVVMDCSYLGNWVSADYPNDY